MVFDFFFLSPFFFLALSSPPLPLAAPLSLATPLALAASGLAAVRAVFFGFLAGFDVMPSSSPSSSASCGGSATTKRYLHLGHSIFLPTCPASRIVTDASQLGQSCLKLVVEAMALLRF